MPDKGRSNQKTMNSKYLENQLTSDKFRVDLSEFLDKKFLRNYEEKRIKKIENFVEKIEKKFFTQEVPDIEALKDYLERNSKCKLPWSNYELKLARQSVLLLLDQRNLNMASLQTKNLLGFTQAIIDTTNSVVQPIVKQSEL